MFILKLRRKIIRIKNACSIKYLEILYGKKFYLSNANLGKRFEFDIAAKNYQMNFGKNISFKRYGLICIRENGQLSIGNNVFFNSFISINCHYKISIGDDCIFGESVKIYDHNHNYKNKFAPVAKQGYNYGEIVIGKNCWIGSNVIILKGAHIGDNAVIGANCIVFKDILPGTVLKAGNSAAY